MEKMGEAMSEEFGLSEERGLEIAKMVSQVQELKKGKSFTNDDAQIFSQELLGVSFTEAQTAVENKMNGNTDKYEELIKKASETNDISPEQMKDVLGDILTL